MNRTAKKAALLRQAEIQRKSKAQALLKTGSVQSSHAQLTDEKRLIRCDHYKRTGINAKLAFQRDQNEKLARELKAQKRGVSHKLVRRDENGKTKTVELVFKK